MTLAKKIYTLATSAIAISTTGAYVAYSYRTIEAPKVVEEKEPEIIEQKAQESTGSFLKDAFCCDGGGLF